ncbi:MAG: dolichol monophosphate mannose synthase [Methylotenera sp. RIFCSPLOWO2_02_FULL_45_14]|nr:MAG: dolichol monophosphate mannose synthase [Methylotenera sp. RIFCSPLOWO2_02_FULL_45_14]
MANKKPLLSIVTPCFNEEANVEELYRRVKASVAAVDKYDFEFIFIDNHSEDSTVEKLKALAATDPAVKLIVNTRNFGHIRSPYYGILQSRGLATIYLASDLQDPPEMIPEFIRYWEEGYKLVMATKPHSEGPALMHYMRKSYYRLLDGISDITVVNDSTGFGLYDQVVLNQLRQLNEPYPFLRGLICELGYEIKTIPFLQARRLRGITKNNLYTLYDIAMLGIVSHSKLPIRIAAFVGFTLGLVSLITAIVFIVLKLVYWDAFPLGIAPLVIGLFFMLGIQLMFIGILGEYVGSIHTYLQKRPLVVEKERVNF